MSILKKATRIGTSVAAVVAMGTYFAPTAQAAQYSMSTKHLYFNGTLVSSPQGFAALDSASQDYTTFIPIFYIQQLLKTSFGITQTWDGHNWNLAIPSTMTLGSFTGVSPSQDSSKRVVWLNNKAFESPTAITANDPSTGQPTTYFPLWYIQQVFHLLGVQDSWDGTSWKLTADTSSISSPSNIHVPLQNAATDDSSWWTRASSQYYIAAQTEDPNLNTDPISGSKILNLEPGQKLYLIAYSDKQNVESGQTTWSVNSQDATITPYTSHVQTSNNLDTALSTFVATEPGEYTIQAKVNDSYSVPLVITVGLDKLQHQTTTPSPDTIGIRPLPSGLTIRDSGIDDKAGTVYNVYNLDGNWVPISGKTTTGAKFVTIIFGTEEFNPTWSYSIPVAADGTFSAEVKSPVAGSTDMYLFSDYNGDLTNIGNGGSGVDNAMGLTLPMPSNAINLSKSALDVMPTGKMDFNLASDLTNIAATLYQNSTSEMSGIEAINNYVSDYLTYDSSELQPNKYRYQDVFTTFNTQTGICEDFAEMESAMLKSLGIRAETVAGSTPDSTQGSDPTTNGNTDDHEWLQVWNGNQWIIADPTWSSLDETNTAYVSNEFFTNTSSFQSSHVTDTSSIGGTFTVKQIGSLTSH